jgi:hypothetical protein
MADRNAYESGPHDSSECTRLLRENERLDASIRRALNHPERWREVLEGALRYEG